jgi:hypothetical protein
MKEGSIQTGTKPFNKLAIASFITLFLVPFVPLVLGLIALKQINRVPERGAIFAWISVTVAGLYTVLVVIVIVIYSLTGLGGL